MNTKSSYCAKRNVRIQNRFDELYKENEHSMFDIYFILSEEFDLSTSPDYPLVFTVDGVSYAVARPAGDEAFFPANQWVKLGISWDPSAKRLLVSRNGELYPVKKLSSAPETEAAASETVFDIFCDRLYPHSLDREQAARISKQGI